jgi:hypothetical protein
MEEEKREIKYRIKWFPEGTLLILLAVIIDAINWIPIVGDIAEGIGGFIYVIYFFFKGMGILNPRRLSIATADFIIELIPAVEALPFNTAVIIYIIWDTRREDKTGHSTLATVQKLSGAKNPKTLTSGKGAVQVARGAIPPKISG